MKLQETVMSTLGLEGKAAMPARKDELERDERIASMVAPGTVSFEGIRHMLVDGRYRRAYGIRDFASVNFAAWANLFNKTPGSRSTICVKPADGDAIRRSLDHADARAGVNLVSGGSASKTVDNQLNRDHARTQLQMMAEQSSSFLNVSMTYQIEGDTEDEVGASFRHIKDSARPKGFSIDPIARAQEKALLACDPMCTKDDPYLYPRFQINMPADTLAASQPFSCGGVIDSGGTVLGSDASGSMVRVNMMRTASDRANMNAMLEGSSGKGKSRTMKKILLSEYAQGVRVIYIDPEQEAKHMCKKLSGQYINAGGTSKVMLCPLQPRALNFDFNDDGDLDGEAVVGVLRSTINHVRGFYQLAFLTPTSWLPRLDEALVEAYRRHGLTYDTPFAEIDFDDYPSMDELAGVMSELAGKTPDAEEARIFKELSIQTSTGGKDGLFGNLWSGETNVKLTGDFIVFDINSLMSGNVSEAARNAQIYNVLSFVWGEVCMARVSGKPLRLVVDEAHMLLGSQASTSSDAAMSPIAASLLSMIARRARKYNCGLMLATQQLSDFLAPAIRSYAKVLVEGATYKFIFGTDEIEPVRELLRIPGPLANRIPEYGKGKCLLKAGSCVCELQVEATESEDPWIGKAGGK